MFPEMARECAYKGADIMIRTAGYTAPIRHAWRITNQANAFCNLMVTASVCLCGIDGTFDSMGEGMIVDFDGVPLATGGGRPDEIITAEVRPTWCARRAAHWGVENNIYQLGHRGYVAVKGGAQRLPVHVHARSRRGRLLPAVGGGGRPPRRNLVRLRGAGSRARAVSVTARGRGSGGSP